MPGARTEIQNDSPVFKVLLPTEVSISGAATYQNKIELAGASVDNLMDPGNRSSQMDVSRVNGNSQGPFIDTAFLDNLQVLDSNISASEGGFAGGVVKSDLRGYEGKNEAGFSCAPPAMPGPSRTSTLPSATSLQRAIEFYCQ